MIYYEIGWDAMDRLLTREQGKRWVAINVSDGVFVPATIDYEAGFAALGRWLTRDDISEEQAVRANVVAAVGEENNE